MKKWFSCLALILSLSVGACSSEVILSEESNISSESEIMEISAVIGRLQYEDSRTAVTMGDFNSNSINLVWADKDSIGIYPTEGDQLSFPIVEGVGTNKCTFNGGGWALKSSTSYKAYSPFNRTYYYHESDMLPVSMLGQKQIGNGNSDHLDKYDLQIAEGKTPTIGKISFEFKHQVCFIRMDLTAPIAATWKSVTLESDALFTTEATMNISSETPCLAATSTANSVTLDLENIKTEASEIITAYMVVLPINLTDKKLNIILTDIDDNNFETTAVIANDYRNFKAGYARWIKATNFSSFIKDVPYLTFSADAKQILKMSYNVATLEYSVNSSDWKKLGTNTIEFGGNLGNLRLRGKSSYGTFDNVNLTYIRFGEETPVYCSGDIRTLIDYENHKTVSTTKARFRGLFKNCTVLITAPELPATTLADYCYYEMFEGCTSLTKAPKLPAVTMAYFCYSRMFSNCTSLTEVPELPATTLADYCYSNMFSYCTNLIKAPEVLPATALEAMCYMEMFLGCKKLTETPKLPAKTVNVSSYRHMFAECTNLKNAPELPATFLAANCYYSMFYNCTSLINAPELPATGLAVGCYEFMFANCTSLQKAPDLYASTLVSSCYGHMFENCKQLNNVVMLATDIKESNSLNNWLSGVCASGTFVKSREMNSLPKGVNGIPQGWTVVNYGEDIKEIPYVTFNADATQSLSMSYAVDYLEFSVDNGEWTSLGTKTIDFGGEIGTLRLRGKSSKGTMSSRFKFNKTEAVTCTGDIRTLIDYDNYENVETHDASFSYLFQNCTSLITAPDLPIVNLDDYCFSHMFEGCVNLSTVPKHLPATKLSKHCYDSMFRGCTKLTTAPQLPATTLAESCYSSMFWECKNLKTAPQLPATTLAESCYSSMFGYCESLTTAPKLPALLLTEDCYSAMFCYCKKLTTAPQLPATTLAESCYHGMFASCENLMIAPELPATTLEDNCYYIMFMNCKNLTATPILPAKTLAPYCYYWMFMGCTKLNNATILATDIRERDCLGGWLQGVSSTGILTKDKDMESLPSGDSGIPNGWTIKNYDEN